MGDSVLLLSLELLYEKVTKKNETVGLIKFHSFFLKFGGVVSTYFAGLLIHYTHRWDLTFYYLSVITVIWCIVFV